MSGCARTFHVQNEASPAAPVRPQSSTAGEVSAAGAALALWMTKLLVLSSFDLVEGSQVQAQAPMEQLATLAPQPPCGSWAGGRCPPAP